MGEIAPTPRTRAQRMPQRASHERQTIEAILDEALVAHLGFAVGGQPYTIPTLHARIADTIFFHGSAGSRTLRAGDPTPDASLPAGAEPSPSVQRWAREHA